MNFYWWMWCFKWLLRNRIMKNNRGVRVKCGMRIAESWQVERRHCSTSACMLTDIHKKPIKAVTGRTATAPISNRRSAFIAFCCRVESTSTQELSRDKFVTTSRRKKYYVIHYVIFLALQMKSKKNIIHNAIKIIMGNIMEFQFRKVGEKYKYLNHNYIRE